MIEHLRDKGLGVGFTCRVLKLSESAYYARKKRPKPARRLRDEQLMPLIEDIHTESGGTYGVRRISRALRRKGVAVARGTVERLMRELGLEASSGASGAVPRCPNRRRPARRTWSTGTLGRDAGGNGAREDDDCGSRALRLLIGCPERMSGLSVRQTRHGRLAAHLTGAPVAVVIPTWDDHGTGAGCASQSG
ncbi:IS3 family transposase [Streptomyces sp. ME19-01-6]|uniref:IS3 family transposase n=1 Tax=Streptomyces sp. ME19-01-6 TaxID=3028686 RepID=UPI0029A17A19|nr:IS3 family transposase [Streptomyces sp. ME19-01-6]MDX3233042.1 IS3 family transposase [Streptomyces sp. ME19-01-6]